MDGLFFNTTNTSEQIMLSVYKRNMHSYLINKWPETISGSESIALPLPDQDFN